MRQKGFTLVEMLLVLAIIGILITILLPSVFGISQETKETKAKAELHLIQTALGNYYIKNNIFPDDDPLEDWVQALLDMEPRLFNERPADPFAMVVKNDYGYDYLPPTVAGDIPTYVVYTVGVSQAEIASVTASDTVQHTEDCIFVTNAATRNIGP